MIVHRDGRDEWPGLPLRSQPGVSTRLHPTEPPLEQGSRTSMLANARWLKAIHPAVTFVRSAAGPPLMAETWRARSVRVDVPRLRLVRPVRRDRPTGLPRPRLWLRLPPAREAGPSPAQGAWPVPPWRHLWRFVSEVPLGGWIGPPLRSIGHIDPFVTVMTWEQWEHQIHIDLTDYLVRRSQRACGRVSPEMTLWSHRLDMRLPANGPVDTNCQIGHQSGSARSDAASSENWARAASSSSTISTARTPGAGRVLASSRDSSRSQVMSRLALSRAISSS